MMAPKDLRAWSYANWMKVHPLVRQDCINELREKVPADMMATWVAQYKKGLEIGSNNIFFHFSSGMAVRNILRKQLLDEELPGVRGPDGGYPKGELVKNWDDVYMGALQEMIEQEITKGGRAYG